MSEAAEMQTFAAEVETALRNAGFDLRCQGFRYGEMQRYCVRAILPDGRAQLIASKSMLHVEQTVDRFQYWLDRHGVARVAGLNS